MTTNTSFFYLYLCLSLLASTATQAQNVALSGCVTDSVLQPLPYVNILATPLASDNDMTFAITNNNGRYRLTLHENTAYKITVSYMGYGQQIDTLSLTAPATKDYTLLKQAERLETVVISSEMAMIVKKDTITYHVDKFRNGQEHKLRDLLKNLPGVEVDRKGNVTVNGKAVTKLLVEGKQFFTGDEKLGVNNIPADAVKDVVVLDDYHDIPFLKNLTDSNEMALNIKLKEGKKKFIFGDITLGGGLKERYLIHPNLFYYSPKTSVNAIFSLNNTGEETFSLQDYISFEGEPASFRDNSSAYFNLQNSGLAQFLMQQNYRDRKTTFGAINLSQALSPVLLLNAYSINYWADTRTKATQQINYLTSDSLTENRLNAKQNAVFFTLNKLALNYTPNYQTSLSYNTLIKASQAEAAHFINSTTPSHSSKTTSTYTPKRLSLHQQLDFSKQFSYQHTLTANLQYDYSKAENQKDWLFDSPIFSNLIPLIQEDSTYHLQQQTSTQAQALSAKLKHFWVLNNYNHLYPIVGFHLHHQTYGSLDYQRLNNGSVNPFFNSGFNNELSLDLFDFYAGVEYKRMLGKLVLKPGLIYHHFQWKIQQFGQEISNKSKGGWLPKLSAKLPLSAVEEIDLDYSLNTSFSPISQYANRLRLASFNQLYRGQSQLENELYHDASLTYSYFNLYKDVSLYIGVNYHHKTRSVQRTTSLQGIDQINTMIYTSLPESDWGTHLSYRRKFGPLELGVNGRASYADYSQIINSKTQDYDTQTYYYRFRAQLDITALSELSLSWQQRFSTYDANTSRHRFISIAPSVDFRYHFFKNLTFNAKYSFHQNRNTTTDQRQYFSTSELSLDYWKEGSLWRFGLSVHNLFDNQYRSGNSYNNFLISQYRTYIQPRRLLFHISYKL